MNKYKRKPEIVYAKKYTSGMEDGWIVYFSGNMFNYKKTFKTKEEASEFIILDLGYLLLDEEDKKYNDIIYEKPLPYIKIYNNIFPINEGQYIITNENGNKTIRNEVFFENEYEGVKE